MSGRVPHRGRRCDLACVRATSSPSTRFSGDVCLSISLTVCRLLGQPEGPQRRSRPPRSVPGSGAWSRIRSVCGRLVVGHTVYGGILAAGEKYSLPSYARAETAIDCRSGNVVTRSAGPMFVERDRHVMYSTDGSYVVMRAPGVPLLEASNGLGFGEVPILTRRERLRRRM